jgi:hypothetical protein
MANRQVKRFRAAVRKAKKVHDITIYASVVGYQGKKPIVEERQHQHGATAFQMDRAFMKNKQIYRTKNPKEKFVPRSVTSLIG